MRLNKKGQAILEYIIVLTAIVSAFVAAADRYIKPAVEKMMEEAARSIEISAAKLTER